MVTGLGRFVLRFNGSFAFINRRCQMRIKGASFFVSLLFCGHTLSYLMTVRLGMNGFGPRRLNRLGFCLRTLGQSIGGTGRGPDINLVLYACGSSAIIRCTLDDDLSPAVMTSCALRLPSGGLLRRGLHRVATLTDSTRRWGSLP